MDYFNRQCAYCGREMPLYRDHISSQLNADSSYLCYNIVPACKSCNSSKRNKNMIEWYREKEFFSQERLNKIIKWSESQRSIYNDYIKSNTLNETKRHFASKIFLTVDRELLAWVDAQAKAENRDRNNWIITQILNVKKEVSPMEKIFNGENFDITVVTDLRDVVIPAKSYAEVAIPENVTFNSDSFYVQEEGDFYAKTENCGSGADIEIYRA